MTSCHPEGSQIKSVASLLEVHYQNLVWEIKPEPVLDLALPPFIEFETVTNQE